MDKPKELKMDHSPSKEVSVNEKLNSVENVDWQLNKKMEEKISFLYLNPHLADVTFNVGSKDPKKIPAHQFILCIGSPVFEAIFENELKESMTRMVHLEVPDVKPDTFEALLAHIYLDKISLNEGIVFELLHCSQKYMLPFLTKECIIYLSSIVKSQNAIILMSETRFYDCPEFWSICWDIFSSNPDLCYQADTFINIDLSTLHYVLSREKLLRSESVVFEATLRWVTHRLIAKGIMNEEEDPEILGSKKRKELGTAFYYLCLEKMSAKEIAELVVPSCVLSSNELVNLFVNKALIDPTVEPPSWRSKELILCSNNRLFGNVEFMVTSSSFTFEVTSSVFISGLTVLASEGSSKVEISVTKAGLVCGSSSCVNIYNEKDKEYTVYFPASFRLDPKVEYTATVNSLTNFIFYVSKPMPLNSSLFIFTSLPPTYGYITRIKYDVYE
ncbi:BTB/POZ domain-containing protein 6-B-like [Lepeophtheirus salmonis]|uniref:BTB/POZ domain-containing protein 6-B-like n=1 Tax=Lepeophtheirus salmonis TaxID=72036 RepID=UPI001AE745B9|nr:BTB/POZ domain-containing protein 6-like [Lepeophtheirus salmonis]